MIENIKYLTGEFLIQAKEAFLNGGGSTFGVDQNVVMPKFMWLNGQKVPYISSQSWKHWLRDTLIEETSWPKSELRAVGWNEKNNTSKIAGMLDPINYPEDDIFGYMFAYRSKDLPKTASEEQKTLFETLPKEQVVRSSTLLASLLSAIQLKGTISTDEAFVHLKGEETPLPYTTSFYNADLSAIFGLDLSRLGVFNNISEHELNTALIQDSLDKNKIEILKEKNAVKRQGIYIKSDREKYVKDVTINLIKALVMLRGGAKLAQFGADVTPKAMVLVGLDFTAPVFNNLFIMGETKPMLNISLLQELISDYKDRIISPILIGIRNGYLENEKEVNELVEYDGVKIVVTTPLKLVECLS